MQKSFDNHLHDDNGDGTCAALQLDKSQSNLSNCNFTIGYCAWAKDIQGTAIIEAPSRDSPEVTFIPRSYLLPLLVTRSFTLRDHLYYFLRHLPHRHYLARLLDEI